VKKSEKSERKPQEVSFVKFALLLLLILGILDAFAGQSLISFGESDSPDIELNFREGNRNAVGNSVNVQKSNDNFGGIPKTEVKRKETQFCSYKPGSKIVSGNWAMIDEECERTKRDHDESWWINYAAHWCENSTLHTSRGVTRPGNKREIFKSKECDIRLLALDTVRSCLAKSRLALVGDSTMREIFYEIILRVLGPDYIGRYDLANVEPTSEMKPSSVCLGDHKVKVDPALSPCFHLNLSTSHDIFIDQYTMPLAVFRQTPKVSGDKMLPTELAFVRYKSFNLHKNFGGAACVAKEPFHSILKNTASWADTIVLNNVLHSMGEFRHVSQFGNSPTKAREHFVKLREEYRTDLRDVVLPLARSWIKEGKSVVWWSGNKPASSGTRPLLEEYHHFFVEAARQEIIESNSRKEGEILWVDTSQFSATDNHNSTFYTDGVHYGAWGILPKHSAQSTVVARMTAEMLLDAVCGNEKVSSWSIN